MVRLGATRHLRYSCYIYDPAECFHCHPLMSDWWPRWPLSFLIAHQILIGQSEKSCFELVRWLLSGGWQPSMRSSRETF